MITDERRYRKLEKDKAKKLGQIDNLNIEVELIDEEMKKIALNYVDERINEKNLNLYDLVRILERENNNEDEKRL